MKRILLFLLTVCYSFQLLAQTPQQACDIYPGFGSSDPIYLTPFNGKLYFLADDSVHGKEPYVYDSTNGRASLLYDINRGTVNSSPLHIYNQKMGILNNVLYFPAANDTLGFVLYKSDGIDTPTIAAYVDSPDEFITLNGKLYFDAIISGHGYELYSFDGINAPEIYEIDSAKGGSYPNGFTIYNNKMYFSATTNAYGFELYDYDPTTDKISLVQDIAVGDASSYPGHFVTMEGIMYFTASTYFNGNELYAYDGNTVKRLTDVAEGKTDGISSHSNLCVYNGAIYFGGTNNGLGYQLYKYVPATGKAVLVATLNDEGDADPYHFTVYNNRLYFSASDPLHGNELWFYDGINAQMVTDLNPGMYGSLPSELMVWGSYLYFTATDGLTGFELYRLKDTSDVQSVYFNVGVSVYPNPTENDCTLEIKTPQDEKIALHIMDVSGKLVYTNSFQTISNTTEKVTIPMHIFSGGTYFYHLTGETHKFHSTGKIVKLN